MARMKETILSVAIDLFFEKGYFATSISGIAAGCGIQKASIYYHYANKEAILFAIMERTMQALVAHLEQRLTGVTDVEARLRAAVRSHVEFHLRHQKETFIASSELRGLSDAHYRAIVARRDTYEQFLQELIMAGIGAGCFAAGDVKILSYAILTLCTAGASWYNPAGRLSIDAIAGIYEDFILSGLKQGLSEGRPGTSAAGYMTHLA
ncbi:MAG: TetR/AcrR family transcriptional regulator [Desulfosarcinaceae bacterium]|nr:TetR/AcrR family transcriptional regulator [Desulfosarcinaceae bacterium]